MRVEALGRAAAVPLCSGTDPCQEFQAFFKWFLALYRKLRANVALRQPVKKLSEGFFFFFFISEVSTGCNYLRLPSGKCQSSEMSKRRFSAHALP